MAGRFPISVWHRKIMGMTILDRILETKRVEVEQAQRERPLEQVVEVARIAPPARDFLTAVTGTCVTRVQTPADERGTGMQPVEEGSFGAQQRNAVRGDYPRLIAEIKQKSPSAGVIRADFDPVAIARVYHQHGAAALSVLTDETYFGGRLEFIKLVKEAVPLPVLRKEFIIEAYQVFESRAAQADAVLLIAEAIGVDRIAELAPLVHELGMACLVEVHSMENLEAVLGVLGLPVRLRDVPHPATDASASRGRAASSRNKLPAGVDSSSADTPSNTNEPTSRDPQRISYVLGINNRDLSVQRTDIATTTRLAQRLPIGSALVAESGISTRSDVEIVRLAGACAILVGESLLRAPDIAGAIHELIGGQTE
jgi:indole-3-glycerol phosphate synthase